MEHPGLKKKKLFLLDMDGTLYLDQSLFPCTRPFLDAVKQIGGRAVYITNNSSKSVIDYVKKLKALGISARESDFVTSAQATASYLKKHYPDSLLYVFGTQSLKQELRLAGLRITDCYEEEVSVLVMGFDTELCFQKLEDACRLLNKGVPYIATNPDLVCPTWYGSVPDCGSVAGMLKNATGREPVYIGKPQPEMIYTAMELTGYTKEETMVIGDRIYTDVASGLNAGVTAALVLSGETKVTDLERFPQKPDFIFQDVGELAELLLTMHENN